MFFSSKQTMPFGMVILLLSSLLYASGDANAQMKLRHWCARSCSQLTGRTVEDEYRVPTVDVVLWLRMRRLEWLGHVLRWPESRVCSCRQVLLAVHSEHLQ